LWKAVDGQETYVLTGSGLEAAWALEAVADARLEDSPLFSASLAREKNLLSRFFSFSSLGAAGLPDGWELMMIHGKAIQNFSMVINRGVVCMMAAQGSFGIYTP
jgi:hypothetical protein